MEKYVIGFIPPVIGVENLFNTFRLGEKYSKVLTIGEEVFLLDEKEKRVFGTAQVMDLEVGELGEMCLMHAALNHTELHNSSDDAPARLLRTIQRIYGPHIATLKKKTTVISLKRLE